MKIDRRNFLSLGIGVVAGITLSPMPWKLTDDTSIWTQTWPWTPVPPDGEYNYVNSACTLCPGGCGIKVRKVDHRAVKIEGMDGHPVNNGGICILGLSGLQLLYGEPMRIKSPLKRIGGRGEGKWQRISWDQAIQEVAANLKALREDGKASSVAAMAGSEYGTVPELFKRFLTAYGSPNFLAPASVQDSFEMAIRLMHGVEALPAPDLENADFVLSFGAGLLDGWGSPVRTFRSHSQWKENGGVLVQAEPRLSNTAAKADQWLPIKPGTEMALALGIAHVILAQSLHHADFVTQYTADFDKFKEFVAQYDPKTVGQLTECKPERIQEVAVKFAKAKKPLALGGRGKGGQPLTLHEAAAIHALNALVGNINQPGGFCLLSKPDYIRWPAVTPDEIAQKGLASERIDGAGTERYPFARCLPHKLIQAVCDADESPVGALLVAETNPVYNLAPSEKVKQAFEKIPFIVSFSSFADETARMADIVLPNHSYLERYQDVPAPMGLSIPLINMARPVVSPQFNTRHVGDSLMALAKALGGSVAEALAWEDYQSCLKETFGENWETIEADGFLADLEYQAPAWEESFAEKKFAFFSGAYGHGEKMDELSMPDIEGDGILYPLVLVPYDSMRMASGYVADPPFVMKTIPDTVVKNKKGFVEINPVNADFLGIKEGDVASLSTPQGKVKVKVHLYEGIKPGVIAMPRGLGHCGPDKYMAGKGENLNQLIAPVEDPASGLDGAWGIRAKLTKLA